MLAIGKHWTCPQKRAGALAVDSIPKFERDRHRWRTLDLCSLTLVCVIRLNRPASDPVGGAVGGRAGYLWISQSMPAVSKRSTLDLSPKRVTPTKGLWSFGDLETATWSEAEAVGGLSCSTQSFQPFSSHPRTGKNRSRARSSLQPWVTLYIWQRPQNSAQGFNPWNVK